MVPVLHVYKEVQIVNEYLQGEVGRHLGMGTISYDEKPGIQALAVTTPDRPPVPGQHASHLRDYEYKRLGTVSLLAGLDLHTGRIIETVSDTHKSADFIAFLKSWTGPIQGTKRSAWCWTTIPRISRKRRGGIWTRYRSDSCSCSHRRTAHG